MRNLASSASLAEDMWQRFAIGKCVLLKLFIQFFTVCISLAPSVGFAGSSRDFACDRLPFAYVQVGETFLRFPAVSSTSFFFDYNSEHGPSGPDHAHSVSEGFRRDSPTFFCAQEFSGEPWRTVVVLSGTATETLIETLGGVWEQTPERVQIRYRFHLATDIEVYDGDPAVLVQHPGMPETWKRSAGWIDGRYALFFECTPWPVRYAPVFAGCTFSVLRSDGAEVSFTRFEITSDFEVGRSYPELTQELIAKFEATLGFYASPAIISD
jgi:hypothetical protein